MTQAAAISVIAMIGAIAYLRHRYVFVSVHGDSMVPTLASGDRVLVRRGAARIAPGQLVVARKPLPGRRWADPDAGPVSTVDLLVKRVAAVNRGPGTLILVGDNAASSWDSRQWGPCPLGRVLGVVVRIFPAA
jgi:phage repressor protein C with HTH and peptisase S24 domain